MAAVVKHRRHVHQADFSVDALKGEIEGVMNADGGVVREVLKEDVPGRVDEVTFWERYFYKVWKIRKVEEARVMLVKKAVADEELGCGMR
ncbi:BSD domain-containing protein 1-like protein [Tanacetum coccineum]